MREVLNIVTANMYLIDELCIDESIKVYNLCHKIGISPSTMARWSNGCEPSLGMIIKVARYFKRPFTDFININE